MTTSGPADASHGSPEHGLEVQSLDLAAAVELSSSPGAPPPSVPDPGRDLDEILADLVRQTEEAARTGGDWHSRLARLSGALAQQDRDIGAIDPGVIDVPLAGFPLVPSEAFQLMVVNRIVNRRIAEDYYARRLVVLACQEKTSSTLHEVAVLRMLHHAAGVACVVPMPRTLFSRQGVYSGPAGLAGSSFHHHWLHYLPNGGVARGVFHPHKSSTGFIRLLKCKSLILTRHPADRLVAHVGMYHRRLASELQTESLEPIYDSLIDGEFLWRESLAWLAAWGRFADDAQNQARVIRYEDMIRDPLDHFESIHGFLFGGGMGDSAREAVQRALDASGNRGALQSGDTTERFYPKGYTGKAGVWRDHFSPGNTARYNEVVSRFLRSHPQAHLVERVYPDLVLRP